MKAEPAELVSQGVCVSACVCVCGHTNMLITSRGLPLCLVSHCQLLILESCEDTNAHRGSARFTGASQTCIEGKTGDIPTGNHPYWFSSWVKAQPGLVIFSQCLPADKTNSNWSLKSLSSLLLFQLSAVLMFSKATANFVRQIDPEGSLIHVSRVNDSQKLVPMALVVKRNRVWFWQRPKYQPTDFTLSDLLQGDEALSPGM